MADSVFLSRDRHSPFAEPVTDLARWQDRREQASKDRKRYEPTWALCQAFVANKQWVGWSRRDRRIVAEPNPQNRERHTVNVLTSYLMTNVGKLAAEDLKPQLFFRNDGVEAQRFMRQANKAVEFAWDEEVEADEKLYDAFLRMCVFGTAAVMPLWNPTRGPVIAENVPYGPDGPMLGEGSRGYVADQFGQGKPTDLRDVRGCLDWKVLSPHNILPPPGINHERDFPWVIVEQPASIENLRLQYGDKADGLIEQSMASVDMMGLRDTIQIDDSASSQTTQGRLKGHTMLYRGYEAPSRQHPKGRVFVWTQETVLEKKNSLPYVIGGEPRTGLRFFKYNMIPDRFWSIGLVEPGIGPQRQRNRSRSQYIELKDRAGLGRIYTRPNAVNATHLAGGKIAEVIEVRPGVEIPTETSGLGPGPWMQQDIQMHDSDMDKVMGMGQVTLGQGAPGGVSAYSAMALLAEQDDKRFGPILKACRNNIAWLVKFTLQDARRYWGPQKQIMLAGEDDQIDAFIFDATRLPSEMFVKVGKGAPKPTNQAAEIQKVFDLYDRAIAAGQPLPPQWLYDSLEQGKALPLPTGPNDSQREKAEVENLLIARGGVVDVSRLDNHNIHIAEHTEAVEIHMLIPGAEDVVRALTEHLQEHETMVQQQATPATTAPSLQGGFGAAGGSTGPVRPQTPLAPPGAGGAANIPAAQSVPSPEEAMA